MSGRTFPVLLGGVWCSLVGAGLGNAHLSLPWIILGQPREPKPSSHACWHRGCPGTAPADFSTGKQKALRILLDPFTSIPEWMGTDRGCFIPLEQRRPRVVPVTNPGLPPCPAPELPEESRGQGQPLHPARSTGIPGFRCCPAVPGRWSSSLAAAGAGSLCEGKSRRSHSLEKPPGLG